MKNSVQLKNVYTLINTNEPISDNRIEELIDKIINIKHINNNDFKQILQKYFKKRNRLLSYKLSLKQLYEEQIYLNNTQHKELLMNIWKHFNENEEIELIDNKWCIYINILIYYSEYWVSGQRSTF